MTESAGARIGFVGAGRMATALARGLIRSGFVAAERVLACDVLPEAAERFASATGGRVVGGIAEVAAGSDVLVLAIKPQQMAEVLAEAAPSVGSSHLVVSIAAGIPISMLRSALGEGSRVVRVMPNTPALVGEGASAFAPGGKATEEDAELVARMFSTVGMTVRVPEELLDAVTGLSGSGPAFVYEAIEALGEGGERAGLPREIAAKLAAQTVLGAARMVLETREPPSALREAVTSPGGTTVAGLRALERGGFRQCLVDAVLAAAARSRELGGSP